MVRATCCARHATKEMMQPCLTYLHLIYLGCVQSYHVRRTWVTWRGSQRIRK